MPTPGLVGSSTPLRRPKRTRCWVACRVVVASDRVQGMGANTVVMLPTVQRYAKRGVLMGAAGRPWGPGPAGVGGPVAAAADRDAVGEAARRAARVRTAGEVGVVGVAVAAAGALQGVVRGKVLVVGAAGVPGAGAAVARAGRAVPAPAVAATADGVAEGGASSLGCTDGPKVLKNQVPVLAPEGRVRAVAKAACAGRVPA